MSFGLTLGLVLLAAYGVASLLLSAAVALACRARPERAFPASRDLLVLRLLPSAGAGLLALTVVLPAFLAWEPVQELEAVGPLLLVLALCSAAMLGDGLRRGWRASAAAERLLAQCLPLDRWPVDGGHSIDVVEVREPIVAVVGGWRTRIVAARGVVAECSAEELRLVAAHEAAHITTRDNLKGLLLVSCPDALAWLPVGATLADRWRTAAEFEADERAAGADRRKRVALAAALVKVARLSAGLAARPALSMTVALDDVEGRVRRLLAPAPHVLRRTSVRSLVACALLLPVAAVPFYGALHQVIEVLVAFGR